MSSYKDKLKQNYSKKLVENKVKKVENNEKKYNKTRSKSKQAYIDGDYKKAISGTAYGVKKALSEGQKVNGYGDDYIDTKGMKRSNYIKKQNGENPYEAKYLYTGKKTTVKAKDGTTFTTRNRMLTDKEKENYNKKGNTSTPAKKSYLDTERHVGGKFEDRLKTSKLDGIETAKYNQEKGKHVSNALNWVKGVGKDFIADPIVDALKTFDRYESAGLNGLYGLGEQAVKSAKAFNDSYSKIEKNEGVLKNWTNAFKEAKNTFDGKQIKEVINNSLKESDETGWGRASADTWRDMIERNGGQINNKQNMALNVGGFVADVFNPINIGGKVVDATKFLGKNAVKSLKGIPTATDIMTPTSGILPSNLQKFVDSSRSKATKTTGASDDVFFNGQATPHGKEFGAVNQLDNMYKNAVNKVEKPKIETTKPQLNKFLSKLEVKAEDITPIKSDGVIRDKGFNPVIKDELSLKRLDNEYRHLLAKQGDELIDELDNLPEIKQDEAYDYIMKRDPELYKTLVYESDVADDIIKSDLKYTNPTNEDAKLLSKLDPSNEKFINEIQNKDLRSVKNVNTPDTRFAHEKINDIAPRKTIKENTLEFTNKANYYFETKMARMSEAELSLTSEVFKDMGSKLTKTNQDKTIEALNKALFGGQKVIRNNIPRGDLKQLINYLEDNANYHTALRNNIPSIKVHDKKGNLVTFNMFDKTGTPRKLENKINMFARNMVDDLFEDKKKLKAHSIGVENLNEVKEPLDAYKYRIEELGEKLSPKEQKHYLDLQARKKIWDKVHLETRDMDFDEFNKYVAEKYPNFSVNAQYDQLVDDASANSARTYKSSYEDKKAELRRNDELRSDRGQKELDSLEKRGIKYDEQIESSEEIAKKKEALSKLRKELGLNYVKYENIKVPNTLKQDYNTLSKHSDVKKIFDNMKKLLHHEVYGLSKEKDIYTFNLIRDEVKNYTKVLNSLGVDNKAYFDEMKNYKLSLISKKLETHNKIKKTKLADKMNERWNIKDVRPKDFDTSEFGNPQLFKRITKEESELNALNKMAEKFELEQEYERILNASNPDELFMNFETKSPNHYIPQSGDNISNITKQQPKHVDDMQNIFDVDQYLPNEYKIKKQLNEIPIKKTNQKQMNIDGRTLNKRYTQTKDGYVPQLKDNNSPLDEIIGNNVDVDSQVSLLDYITNNNLPVDKRMIDNYKPNSHMFDNEKLASIDERINKRLTPQRMEEILGESLEDTFTKANEPVDFTKFDKTEGVSKAIDAPESVSKQAQEELAVEIEELAKNGVDALQEPPKQIPKNMSPNLYKRWLNTWKKSVTLYNPGWHVQNYFQNKGQNYFKFGVDALKPQTDARNVLKTIKGENAKNVNINGLNSSDIASLAIEHGVVDGFVEDAMSSNGLFGKFETKLDNSGFVKKLNESEKVARLNHFILALKEGMSPEEASKSVNKYLYDYNNANKVDEVIKEWIDPFWMFHKNNARMLTQSSIEHPSRMNNIMRGERGLNGGIPEEQQQGEDSRWREFQDPSKTYTDKEDRQYNYLYDQSMFSTIKDAVPMSEDALENKLNPFIQATLRGIRGEGKFGNKIVEGDEAGFNEITKKDALMELIRDINPVAPTLVNTINKNLSDKEKVENGTMDEYIAGKRELNEWLKYITGHKGNWYRNLK